MIDLYYDSREQKPLQFEADYINSVSRVALPYGDYACKSGDDKCPVFFERKSLPDLFGTMGKGYKRFRKEIKKSIEAGHRLVIIIEKPLLSIQAGYKRSKMPGVGVMRTLFTLMTKHKIPFVTCKNREEMSLYIGEFYRSWALNKEKK